MDTRKANFKMAKTLLDIISKEKKADKRNLRCPHCQYATDITSDLSGDNGGVPALGDANLCANCGEVSFFAEGNTLVLATLGELLALPLNIRMEIQTAQTVIRTILLKKKNLDANS